MADNNYVTRQDELNKKNRDRLAQNNPKEPKQGKTDLEILAEKMNESKEVESPVEYVKSALNKTVTALTSESMKERKEALKQGKAMFDFIRSSNLELGKERKDLLLMWEEALDDGKKTVSTLGIIAEDLKTGFVKKIPTLGNVFNALLKESNPIIGASVNLFSELKDYYRESRSAADQEEKDRIAALDDIKKETEAKKKMDKAADKLVAASEVMKQTEHVVQKKTSDQAPTVKKERAKPYAKLVPPLEQLNQNSVLQLGLLEKVLEALTRNTPNKVSSGVKKAPEAPKVAPMAVPAAPVMLIPEAEKKQTLLPLEKRKPEPKLNRAQRRAAQKKTDKQLVVVKKTPSQKGVSTPDSIQTETLAVEKEQTKGILSGNSTLDEMRQISQAMLTEIQQQNKLTRSKSHDADKNELRALKKPRAKENLTPMVAAGPKEPGMLSFLAPLLAPVVAFFGQVGNMFTNLTKLPVIGKVFSLFTDVTKAFGTLDRFVAPAAKLLPQFGKFLGPIGIIFQVVESLFDFVDGWKDADKILGKADVDIRDKLAAGVGSAVGGFLGIIDTVLGWFDIKTDIEGVVKDKASKFLAAVLHPIDTVKGLYDEYVTEGKWMEKLTKSFTELMELPGKMLTSIKDKLQSTYESAKDTFIPDMLRSDEDRARLNAQKLNESSVMNGLDGTPAIAPLPNAKLLPSIQQISQGEQSVVRLNQEREAERAKQAQTNVNMPVQNNVNNSRTTINNQPLTSRNDADYLFSGLGLGSM